MYTFPNTAMLDISMMDVDYVFQKSAKYGQIRIVELLLNKANITSKNNYAITYACKNNHVDIAKLLLMQNIHIPTEKQTNILQYAIKHNYTQLILLLLEYKIGINQTLYDFHTILKHQNVIIVKSLLDHGIMYRKDNIRPLYNLI